MAAVIPILRACLAAGLVTACGPQLGAAPESAADTCEAAAYQDLVGRTLAAVTLPETLTTRILEPGAMASMDYREDRLNVQVDGSGTITRVYCG